MLKPCPNPPDEDSARKDARGRLLPLSIERLTRVVPPTTSTILRVGDPDERSSVTVLEASGAAVLECDGPNGSTCPLVEGQGCSLVDDAAGIVFELDLDDPYNREILRCYRERSGPRTPIQVIASPDRRERHRDSLTGVPVMSEPAVPALANFVDRVELADMARRALSELVGSEPLPRSSRSSWDATFG